MQEDSRMVDIKCGLLRTFIVWAAFAFLTLCGGQSQKIGPRQQITVMVGDDAILPCHLEPPVDAVSMTIEWGRPDLDPRFVIVWHDGQELLADQNKVYEGRASLSVNKLKLGDLSVKLSKANIFDNGTYRCFIPKLNKEHFVELLVGAASSPGISLAGIHEVSSGVMLDCRSEGWYPEPELFWLDGEGNLLSAGPTETVRGPDDLYTVSRRLTARKSGSFTCRVQQKNINQTRETHVYVPDDFFSPPCSSNAHIVTIISLAVVLMVVLAVIFVVWTRRRKPNSCNFTTKTRGSDNTELPELPQLLPESIEGLDEKQTRLDEEFKKVEEEYKDLMVVLALLNNNKIDVKQQKEVIETQVKIQNQKKAKQNNTKHHGKGSLETKARLDPVQEVDRKLQDADTKLRAVIYGETVMREKKTKLDNIMEEINKQLQEINDQRNEGNSSQDTVL